MRADLEMVSALLSIAGSVLVGLSQTGRESVGAPVPKERMAVLDGLRWLARHQNPDGSWGARSSRAQCSKDASCWDAEVEATDHYDTGLTALALLGFLGAGFEDGTEQDLVDPGTSMRYPIGPLVRRGLEWLRAQQRSDGSFTPERSFLYNDALATMAFAEAYRLTLDPAWSDVAQKGVLQIEAAQRKNPSGEGAWGWRYQSRKALEEDARTMPDGELYLRLQDADTSVTGWCILALDAAWLAGLDVQWATMAGAVHFVRSVTGENGLVGYTDAKSAGATVQGPFSEQFTYHPTTMSALGMCIRTFTTHDPEDPFFHLAAKRIVQDSPAVSESRDSIDYYYWHVATIALHQLDGPESPVKTGRYWGPWNKAVLETLLSLQVRREGACCHGGWVVDDRWAKYSGAGPLLSTALNVLTLETRDRRPNAFAALAKVGTAAPDFAVTDDLGAKCSLADLSGRVVLLDFARPTSPSASRRYLDSRKALAVRLRGKPFTLWTLGLRGEGSVRLPTAEERDAPDWRLLEGADPALQSYRVGQRPTTVVVDPRGWIRGWGLSWTATTELIDELLAEIDARPK